MEIGRVMIQLRTLFVGAALLQGLGISAARGGDQPGTAPEPRHSAGRRMVCGPNALYLLLRLDGLPVTYRDVVRELGSDDKPMSIVELRDAAARLGLSTRIRHCTLEDLDRCTVPFIAHSKSDFGSVPDPDRQVGHFLVVLKVDDMIHLIDGTTGEVREYPRRIFMNYWTGHLLEPRSEVWTWAWMAILLDGIGFPVALGLVLLVPRPRSLVAARKLGAGLLLIACGSACGPTAVAASDPSTGTRDELAGWRSPTNDGLTCLYLQLAALGHPTEYARIREAVAAEGGTPNLVTLRDAARRCGVPMKIIWCSPDDLKQMPKPVITYLHGVGTGGGFALLYGLDGKKYGLILGATACIQEMTVDRFRQDWSGIALVPEPPGSGWWESIAAGLVLIAAYSGWRLWIAK
jgi:hypothetical protein